eukprot:CAMPEP_0175822772 /NCGR_PEP_ID=MMETSP0107_2-20121207/9857_1 /TAXON_ID=195067 ORGANISM="Goniomonas pacifica, Strain CCMP1869" /NCGR_SAMPLE_ID=MMETSP0107_2 /ASSEMBLY_ACC=CAM_ASM_000203 /LENGTH=102 /DNA_ID=CAMNT_0017135261 /DNA_START=11 /DNA_END=316 /DNA_ORIENTATION=+
MAGLYDVWKNPDGELVHSFTIITVDAAQQLGWLHDRMPLILDEAAMELWLDMDTPLEQLSELMRPYNGALQWRAVGPKVNDVRNNTPDCILPLEEYQAQLRA